MPGETNIVAPSAPAFCAAISGLVAAASATDIFTITGADGRRIKIYQIRISGIATAAASIPIIIIKRSSLNTTGTSTAVTPVLLDTRDTLASLATVRAYTANPGALGTAAGNLTAVRLGLSTASTANNHGVLVSYDGIASKQPALNSALESICINYDGTTVSGNALDIEVSWTEEQV